MEKIIEGIREVHIFYYLLLIALPVLYLIFKSPRNLPPGPFPWPVIGNILSMGNKPHVSLAQLAASYGPLISLRLGTKILVIGSSPDAATEILKTHDKLLSARSVPRAHPALPDQLDSSVIWADCTDNWNYLRTLVKTELFTPKMIEAQVKTREKKVSEMVEFLLTKEGQMVNVGEMVFNMFFNTLSCIYASRETLDLYEEKEEGLKVFIRRLTHVNATPNLADYYALFSGFDLQGLHKKSREMSLKIAEIWEPILKERIQNRSTDGTRERDLLDGLLDRGFTKDQINYLFLELFVAGVDTTTSTVEWALAELIKNPEAMKIVRAELETEIKGAVVKESDLPSLPYLHNVLKETLRLHPPAPLLIPRRALESCKVMSYTIPKDTQIFLNVWAIGRDPQLWEDPLAFKPERFHGSIMELNTADSDFKFIPFGYGRRTCPGVAMASRQAPLFLASLLKSFDWALPNNMQPTELDMEEKFGVTLEKDKPLVLIPKFRNSSA
ncbi:hypothetical protein ACHQM5_000845 [Ranunculus cassubicifolius]